MMLHVSVRTGLMLNFPTLFPIVAIDILLCYRYAHLLPKDDEAFEHYNALSSKRLDEVFTLKGTFYFCLFYLCGRERMLKLSVLLFIYLFV